MLFFANLEQHCDALINNTSLVEHTVANLEREVVDLKRDASEIERRLEEHDDCCMQWSDYCEHSEEESLRCLDTTVKHCFCHDQCLELRLAEDCHWCWFCISCIPVLQPRLTTSDL